MWNFLSIKNSFNSKKQIILLGQLKMIIALFSGFLEHNMPNAMLLSKFRLRNLSYIACIKGQQIGFGTPCWFFLKQLPMHR